MTTQERNRKHRISSPVVVGVLVSLAVLALGAGLARAGSDERRGTSGASELLIPVGPRASALGPAAAGDIDGVEAIYWNPSGIASLENTEALFSHTSYFADMSVNYAAIAVPAHGVGVLGFSAKVLSVGSVIVTTEEAPDGTGETLSPTFAVLGLSWARAFTDRVRFGLTTNLVNEHVANMTANGLAMDFGVQYAPGWQNLRLGIGIKNIGNSMRFDGEGLEVGITPPGAEPNSANRVVRFTTAAFEMPSYLTMSAGFDALKQANSAVRLRAAYQSNNFGGDQMAGAAEWRYKDFVALRGSWYGTMTTHVDATTGDETLKFGSGDDLYSGYALGGGVIVKPGGTRLAVDVAWRPVREFFNDIYEVGLRVAF